MKEKCKAPSKSPERIIPIEQQLPEKGRRKIRFPVFNMN